MLACDIGSLFGEECNQNRISMEPQKKQKFFKLFENELVSFSKNLQFDGYAGNLPIRQVMAGQSKRIRFEPNESK